MIRAIIILILAWLIGQGIAAIAQSVIDDHIKNYKEQNPVSPVPGDEDSTQLNSQQPGSTTQVETPDHVANPTHPDV